MIVLTTVMAIMIYNRNSEKTQIAAIIAIAIRISLTRILIIVAIRHVTGEACLLLHPGDRLPPNEVHRLSRMPWRSRDYYVNVVT